MYFITSLDPNYTVKGSRDPLGFQVIWQEAGRMLIPHLSTVSANIIDFQILCLAFALKKELNIGDNDFEAFFIRFEQLMAYTRFAKNNTEGFNGIDKVRKTFSSGLSTVKISNAKSEQILSNQKAYGIWGKYIRPFTDMEFTKQEGFWEIFIDKIQSNSELLTLSTLLKKKTDTAAQIKIEKLDALFSLLEKPKATEKQLFINNLLKDNFDNELLKIIKNEIKLNEYSFYEQLDYFYSESKNERFKATIHLIKQIEKVLSPLNHIFRHLQTRSFWKIDEINKDEFISRWRTNTEDIIRLEPTQKLSKLLHSQNIDLVKGLVQRNKEISAKRNCAPWINLTDFSLEVNHFEGGYTWDDYNPEKHSDNNYFLGSFISLNNQLQ